MVFGTRIPYYDERLTRQLERTDVNDKFFKSLFEPPTFLTIHRIIQAISFLVFLGPLKLVFSFVMFLMWSVVIRVIPLFESFFKTQKDFKTFSQKILRSLARSFLFTIGIINIDIQGSVDYDARFIVSNHVSLLDYFIYFSICPVTIIKKADIPGWESLLTGTVIDMFYISPKDKYITPAEQLENLASDPNFPPILHFPEGRPTNGHCVLSFKTHAFASNYYAQTASISYYLGFTFRGFNTVYSTDEPNYLLYFRILAIPYLTCKVHFLQHHESKVETERRIPKNQKAEEAQLQVANDLGILAITRSDTPSSPTSRRKSV